MLISCIEGLSVVGPGVTSHGSVMVALRILPPLLGGGGAPCRPTKRNSTYHSNFESARQPHVNTSLESHNTPESHVPKSEGQALASFISPPQIAHLEGKSAKGASNHQDVDDCFQGELHLPQTLSRVCAALRVAVAR
jgi:hypothetical protein